MINILIPSDQTRAVTCSKTGRRFLVQRAGLVQSDGRAQPFDLLFDPDRGEKPYPAGGYTFADFAGLVFFGSETPWTP